MCPRKLSRNPTLRFIHAARASLYTKNSLYIFLIIQNSVVDQIFRTGADGHVSKFAASKRLTSPERFSKVFWVRGDLNLRRPRNVRLPSGAFIFSIYCITIIIIIIYTSHRLYGDDEDDDDGTGKESPNFYIKGGEKWRRGETLPGEYYRILYTI